MRDAEKSLRIQILATEHWSLLASRSTTQNEVLSRISMFLTLVSAALVSLALVGQATQFTGPFPVFAISVLVVVSTVGVLTEVRVINVALEDLMYVVALNRLRGSYLDVDPGAGPSLLASPFDDRRGSEHTYYFFTPKRGVSQVAGSSMMFVIAVNSALLGLLAAVISSLSGWPLWASATVGGVVALLFALASTAYGGRRYRQVWQAHEPLHPSPE